MFYLNCCSATICRSASFFEENMAKNWKFHLQMALAFTIIVQYLPQLGDDPEYMKCHTFPGSKAMGSTLIMDLVSNYCNHNLSPVFMHFIVKEMSSLDQI